jgi:hypothetical protein
MTKPPEEPKRCGTCGAVTDELHNQPKGYEPWRTTPKKVCIHCHNDARNHLDERG